MSAEDRELGARLRVRREWLGLSQAELARTLSWHQTMVSKTEDGTRKLGFLEALQYTNALDLKLEDL